MSKILVQHKEHKTGTFNVVMVMQIRTAKSMAVAVYFTWMPHTETLIIKWPKHPFPLSLKDDEDPDNATDTKRIVEASAIDDD